MGQLVRGRRLKDYPDGFVVQFSRPFRGGGWRDWHVIRVRQEGDRVLCKVWIIGHITVEGCLGDIGLYRPHGSKLPFRQIWLPADMKVGHWDISE